MQLWLVLVARCWELQSRLRGLVDRGRRFSKASDHSEEDCEKTGRCMSLYTYAMPCYWVAFRRCRITQCTSKDSAYSLTSNRAGTGVETRDLL